MKTTCKPTLQLIRSWLALPGFVGALAASSANLGATNFVSVQQGSWFNASGTWGQPYSPGNGDNVMVTAFVNYVAFDSTNIAQSVTVSNLDLINATLWLTGPASLTMTGTDCLFTGNNFLNGNGGVLHNHGAVFQSSGGTLNIGFNTTFENQPGGSYNLAGDGGFASGLTYAYFNNSGLLRKSGGNGISSFSGVVFNNRNGVIEVDSGTLSLAGGGSSSSGTFNVASGAVLDLTGGSNPTWAGVIGGSGAGAVSLNSGSVNAGPSLILNLPDGLFQWTGGSFSGTAINSNAVTVAGANSVAVNNWSGFYNRGVVHHTNTATLYLGYGTTFENQAASAYNLEGDGGFFSNGNSVFNNYGLLRKSGGNGTSGFGANNGVSFYNLNGSIEVDSGQLSLNGQSYVQGTGSFIVTLGGTNAGQSGQLLCGPATLGGPLQVSLARGYAPAIGDQFQILSSGSLGGAFTTLNVPTGISVNYSDNGVFLVVTGTVPAQIVGPSETGTNFVFSFGTVSNQSYTVQRNDDPNTTNWVYYTNFTGNGLLMQVLMPVKNVPQRFFRVRQP